jgi:hypothetical protein
MPIQVCFFKDFLDEKIITDVLSSIYLVDKYLINKLDTYNDLSIINFEFTKYDDVSDFNIQLEIFLNEETILNSEIYNNLILSIKLVDKLQINILINDESDDPYQWLLLTKNKKLFLIEQSYDYEIGSGINIIEVKGELDLSKAISFFPQKHYIIHYEGNKVYYIDNSKIWEKVIKIQK